MSNLLAIDPGNVESGWALVSKRDYKPLRFGKTENNELRRMILEGELDFEESCVEKVASYGMSVGASVFDTCEWTGRFTECILHMGKPEPIPHFRLQIRTYHCHSSKATDTTVRQALADRFARAVPNYGKGSKAEPGWFYGFKADIWSAYALAVYHLDKQLENL